MQLGSYGANALLSTSLRKRDTRAGVGGTAVCSPRVDLARASELLSQLLALNASPHHAGPPLPFSPLPFVTV